MNYSQSKIQELSIVRFKDSLSIYERTRNVAALNNRFIFQGEIPNMPGHCLLLSYPTSTNKAFHYYPYFVHLHEIEVIPEDEV